MIEDMESEMNDKRKLSECPDDESSSKKPKWKNRGVNKKRPTFKVDRTEQLCPSLSERTTAPAERGPGCTIVGCQFAHDVRKYLAEKPADIGDECYVFNTTGRCPRGLTCRFGTKHITEGGVNVVNESAHERWMADSGVQTLNRLEHEVQIALRKHKYDFTRAEKLLARWQREERTGSNKESLTSKANGGHDESATSNAVKNVGPVLDGPNERKKIDWAGKLFLSPLTTVGNLPFRRVCKEYGADVTCGEMAMAVNLLQGKPQEWALTKRHASEDLFGVQVCGNNVTVMTKCAQLLQDQTNIDFIDINVGCPIDLVYKQGAGSGLLNKKKVLVSMVKCMKGALDIPLTLKTRTGVYTGKSVAHTLVKELSNAGIDLITVHGRSKEQRYTKLADWEYVEQCAQLAAPTPLVGNGDILSYEDYELARQRSPTSVGAMIGRGALYKPWIFTEIKERRHWDISSAERFEMLRRYANYGLEHWGSDTRGVETTRRFLLEWLSFLYRYVPVGILTSLDAAPQKMNERPPPFTGRDELETLMASANCNDWIKISEMLLGPVPSRFEFLPKHKANSWT